MFSSRSNPSRVAILAVLFGVLLLVLPWPALGDAARTTSGAPGVTYLAAGGLGATVTWNGVNIQNGGSVSSALTTSFVNTIDVHYTWSSSLLSPSGGSTLYTVTDARLQLFYFGVALDTRDIVNNNTIPATGGSFDMQWDPGVFRYLFEGTFGLTASLLAPNGTTMWSQNFFIHAAAPFSILAALPIVLLLVGLYEAYGLVTSGRQAAIGSGKKSASQSSSASEKPTEATSATDGEEPSDEPPTGGKS